MRPHDAGSGTRLFRLPQRHTGLHASFFRQLVLCQNDPVTRLGIAAHDKRNAPPLRVVEQFDARVAVVHIRMQDHPFHLSPNEKGRAKSPRCFPRRSAWPMTSVASAVAQSPMFFAVGSGSPVSPRPPSPRIPVCIYGTAAAARFPARLRTSSLCRRGRQDVSSVSAFVSLPPFFASDFLR